MPTNPQNGQMHVGKHSYFSLHLPHLREFILFCLILFPIDKKDYLETTYRPLLWFSIIQDVSNCINQLLLLSFI